MPIESILSSWYPLACSRDLRKGQTLAIDLFDHRLVLFRTNNNTLGVLDRQCPHMGGDLSRGTVSANGVLCPIHHWEFGIDGRRIMPTQKNSVDHASVCQAAIPSVERWGLIFVFLGEKPYFELPESPASMFYTKPLVSELDINYTIPSVFGFDSEHFKTVHHRDLAEMTIYTKQSGHIGMRLIASVGRSRWSDRLMHRFGVNEVETDIDYWAGNIVIGKHTKTKTLALITSLPIDAHRSRVFFVSMQQKPSGSWIKQCLAWARFQLAKPLIRAFVLQDEKALTGVRFNPDESRHKPDNQIVDWLNHVKQLPSVSTSDIFR